jgi:nucleoside-diphosphate-sugar epimerase
VRVALTGASGYTGGRLLECLHARGDEVSVLLRPAGRASSLARLRSLAARVVEGDLADAEAIGRLVAGNEAIVHVAAVYRTAGHPDSYYREVNVGGTERLLEAAAVSGVRRFVHTSTVGVHGHVAKPPADETSAIAPGDIYQATKAEAEALALRYHETRGVPVAVVRPGAIYGPGETRLLKLFRAIARGRYAIVGDGKSFYHPVYIDDLVQGFLLALDRPEAVGEAFLICGPAWVSQAELAERIAMHTGGRVLPFRIPARPIQWAGDVVEALCVPLGIDPPLHRRRVDFWTKSRAFSIEKARRLLGYDPKVGLDEGIARTVASYRELGWL